MKIDQYTLCKPKNREKTQRRKMSSLRETWDTIKHANICIIELPGGEKREKRAEK